MTLELLNRAQPQCCACAPHVARADAGTLDNMYWYDLTCNSCGGTSSQICIQQLNVNSCATPFTNCTCINQPANCSYADPQFDS